MGPSKNGRETANQGGEDIKRKLMVQIKTAFLIGFFFESETEIRQRKDIVLLWCGLSRLYQRASVVCEQHG